MTLEEANDILNSDNFSTYFKDKFNLYTKLSLIRLRDTFSNHLFIPKDEIYSSISYTKFFSVLFFNKETLLDINQIKLDILNNIPFTVISFKYLEPLEVINEIKNKINENILFLDNKIYSIRELSLMLNLTHASLHHNKTLNKINIKKNARSGNLYYGKDLNANINNILIHSKSESMEKSCEIVHIKKLAEEADVDIKTIYTRLYQKKKIFGVNITLINKDGGLFSYVKKEDFDKVIVNKKYYVETAKIKDTFGFKYCTLSNILKYYSVVYKKEICINNKYIKKETVNKIIKVIDTFKNDFNKYLDDLYNTILKNKTKLYKYSTIIKTLVYHRNKYYLEKCEINLKNGFIDKNSILKILDFIKENTNKYKKSKQQGE